MMERDERELVCLSVPYCRCDANDEFTCNCMRDEDERCVSCSTQLVPVSEYERMAAS